MHDAQQIITRLMTVMQITSIKQLARNLGKAETTVRNWIYRQSIPYSACVKVAVEYNICLDWLLLGEEPKYKGKEYNEFIKINKYAIQASAGYGAWHDDENISARLSFRGDQLHKMGLQPKHSIIVVPFSMSNPVRRDTWP